MKKGLFAAVFALLIVPLVSADDWPGFRGPDRSGVSKEKGLLKTWPKDGPKLAWTFNAAGLGHSSCAVVNGVLYTLGTDMDFTEERIIAIDAKTGTQLWTAKIGPVFTFKGNIWGDGPRATPTVDGNLLFALSAAGELVCVNVADKGKQVWRKNYYKNFNGAMMSDWGFSGSPLVDGDLLICSPGGKDGTVAALEKKTGALVWRTKGWTQKATYGSPIVAEIQGVRQYIQTGYAGGVDESFVSGIEAKTGKVLWQKPFFSSTTDYLAPTLLVKGNQVYLTSGGGCHLFDIDAKQNADAQYKKKTSKLVKNAHGGVVEVGGYIYGHTEPSTWICQELATGQEAWREPDRFKCKSGAVITAEGLLYLYTDEGEAALVGADPKDFNVLGSFTIPQRSKIAGAGRRPSSTQSMVWAHPAIANGHLFLRDHELIFAFKIAK